MRRRDLDAVLAIEVGAYSHPWSARIFADCLRVGYRAWVIQRDEGPVAGYVLASIAVGEAHLLNLCVAENQRGQRLAERLLDVVIAQARAEGAGTVMLEVRPSNRAARRLYRRYGFVHHGTRPGYYPGEQAREDAYLMAYEIDS